MTSELRANQIISETGRKQSWLVTQMNTINPSINMTASKLSETLRGKREMSADEMVAFCVATDTEIKDLLASPA